jgi:hypothetical protein
MSKNPSDDIHVVPVFYGEPVHAEEPSCWCEPELQDYTDEGGSRLYIHRRPN